ncbi:MAG: DNA mismatch repair protein MutS [Candidatus Dependentiae bacterium]|nr:DNA mismatch repair protein MutS [Candidatus Dependentiae bacterium]
MQDTVIKHTPLMEQYFEIKAAYPDALLLFQVGDFYELFCDDAKKAAAFLGIALTARGKSDGEPIPLCGVPVHTKDHYIAKLVKGGFNVALCDQLEPPRPGTVVKRGVTQVLTPGTLTDSHLLDAKSASYLFSFFPMADSWGLLFGELLTAQLYATVIKAGDSRALDAQLGRFLPNEVLLPNTKSADACKPFFKRMAYSVTPIDVYVDNAEQDQSVAAWMRTQFDHAIVATVEKQESLRLALYYFYSYVQRNQPSALDQFKSLHIYQADDFLVLDQATQRNLELVKDISGSTKNSLYAIIDGATTAMGSRMIKKWLLRPLVKSKPIAQRHDAIAIFLKEIVLMQQLVDLLCQVGDIERVIGRIALRRALLPDYLVLMNAVHIVPGIRDLLYPHTHSVLFAIMYEHMGDFSELGSLLNAALNSDASKDWIIKAGFDSHLDRLRELVHNSNQKIVAMEIAEQQATGINSLKIRYNQVHGYYIEITKMHIHAIPSYYIRQQTLVGRERYLTPALQQLQYEIVSARTEIEQVEKAVFDRVKIECAQYIQGLRKVAHAVAHLDALLGFAQVAYTHSYVRPSFNENRTITIVAGRHPVVERDMVFIPNDTQLDDQQSLLIITGPNMGGKSTYLRQVALITILAQCGSFVPALRADLALVDRVFTRIGAGDNVAEGKSTFLVEMEETAAICKDATHKSLVILDEVGRGTSTFDGLAIAQGVVEYIFNVVRARCLFATHYHELALLQDTCAGIKSAYVVSKKTKDGIVFLYKIAFGVADGSFGVEVAKLACLPPEVVARAQFLLEAFTAQNSSQGGYVNKDGYRAVSSTDMNLEAMVQLVQENKELKSENSRLQLALNKHTLLTDIDFDQLSPKKAFDLLWSLKEQ